MTVMHILAQSDGDFSVTESIETIAEWLFVQGAIKYFCGKLDCKVSSNTEVLSLFDPQFGYLILIQ